MTPGDKSNLVKDLARRLGCDRVGITRPIPPSRTTYYRDWLARGHAGAMTYLSENLRIRLDPARLLANAKSVICIAVNYHTTPSGQQQLPTEPEAYGKISNYVRGYDYHNILRDILLNIDCLLRKSLPEAFTSRICVDTAPILEKDLAATAGLGWIGKNTLLLHEDYGSYLFLGELVTTLDLQPDAPVTDHCGTCTRCIDACPTQALTQPYQLDASRCISYLTVELRGRIPGEFHQAMGQWIYGCDICQQVCPYNRDVPETAHEAFRTQRLPAAMPLLDLVRLRSGQYRRLVKDNATRRATRNMWRRNAVIALRNSPRLTPEERQALATARSDPDPTVRAAAAGE